MQKAKFKRKNSNRSYVKGGKKKNKRNALKTRVTWLWSVAMKQRIFPLSGFTYHKIYDQDKRSHEAYYQLVTLAQGFPCMVT